MKIRVTAENYEREVLQSELPVLVEFFAGWCPKCAMLADAVDEIAEKCSGILKVCQIEIEESTELADTFEVEVVPTFVIFRSGEPIAAAGGVLHKETILEMLREEAGIEVED